MPNTPARVLALQAGEVDYVDGYYFPLSSVKTVENDKRFQVRETLWPTDDLIILNNKNPPLDNVKVRQALMIATDRQYIQKNIFFGQGDVATSAVDNRLTWAHNPAVNYNKLYPYDPARAAALLTEAGFPPKADCTRFTLRLVFDTARPEYVK
jgi:peptide/nickel transport system substrate-binding protein